jgi:hypothetical protein
VLSAIELLGSVKVPETDKFVKDTVVCNAELGIDDVVIDAPLITGAIENVFVQDGADVPLQTRKYPAVPEATQPVVVLVFLYGILPNEYRLSPCKS